MLRYGIEVEGGYSSEVSFDYQREEMDTQGKNVKILKSYDGSAYLGEDFDNYFYEDEIEFKSSVPIPNTDIEKHIKNWEELMKRVEFVSSPKTCGLHIHTSPMGDWENKKYQTFVYNLFFLLVLHWSSGLYFYKHRYAFIDLVCLSISSPDRIRLLSSRPLSRITR